jgi:hypothetical protein
MIPVRGALWTLGAIVGLFLAWRAYIWNESRLDREREEFRRTVQAKDDSIAVARREKASADSALANQIPIYIAGRDRILHDPAKPASPEVRACYESADKVISACQLARSKDSVLIAQQASLITTLRNPPPPAAARRVQAYGEALYDFVDRAPVGRLGVTARVLGPVSVSAAADLSMPPAGQSHVTTRALVGLRVTF